MIQLTFYIIISKNQIKLQFYKDKHQQFGSKFKNTIYKFISIYSPVTVVTNTINFK